ncbi:hypothetical protein BCR37DRAFT_108383 [Protomyces lactucae-debilis]|uniref:Uncharacterized protein n=1 Tax=Protomyces lactucae-debilis TaxID=2754530 RepID=A0A1Y2F405_PROLT|nr:uncharacterized protein BCR37DRAFT_108383 [Protomyces lactucae-debilis]ORY78583.1 hypothetical protein BCR37DRAFT_108383 [Protomyces lactucae-debilis]
MAILRSAPLGVLSILSCLILGTFLVTVGPSPPAAVTSSHYGYHPLQGMLCKTVLFKFKALIKVNVDRKSSSSTQSNPGTYEEVQGGYTFSSNPEVYGEETTGSASSSKPKTYANRDPTPILPSLCQPVRKVARLHVGRK